MSTNVNRQIILASGSPRRRELLERLGLPFTVVPSEFEEYLDDARSVEEIAKELGIGKAREVAARYPEAIVIGGDTIVTVGTVQLGKPEDIDDARRMWQLVTSGPNIVTTSLAVVCLAEQYDRVVCDQATVTFKPYDEQAIEAYLATGDYADKAGAWSIQHARHLIESVEGSQDTIIGLPIRYLRELLVPVA